MQIVRSVLHSWHCQWIEQVTSRQRLSCMLLPLAAIAICMLAPAAGANPPALAWTARAYGSGSPDTRPAASAVDATGNLFITGPSRNVGLASNNDDGAISNALTMKISPAGTVLWTAMTANVEASGLTLDADGNVILIGYRGSFPNAQDYVTTKLDTAGNQLWQAVLNGRANRSDIPIAVVAAPNGDIYVTGASQMEISNFSYEDMLTVKYDAAGNELWRAAFNGTGFGADRPVSVALAANGDVVVLGTTTNAFGTTDFLTLKYTATGGEVWRAIVNGSANRNDDARALVIDSSGNVLVTGESRNAEGAFGKPEILTVKYNADGIESWRRVATTAFFDQFQARAIALGAGDSIQVGGQVTVFGAGTSTFIVRYDAAGTETFRTTIAGLVAEQMAFDAAGNTIVAGPNAIMISEARIHKIDAQGTSVWQKSIVAGAYVIPHLRLDSAANVLVALPEAGPQAWRFLAVKYDAASGAEQWRANSGAREGLATTRDSRVLGQKIAVDAAGNTYMAGQAFNGSSYDFLVVKFDAAGQELWRAQDAVGSPRGQVLTGLAIDGSGNAYVSGVGGINGASDSVVTIKYGPTGLEQWRRAALYGGTGQDSGVAVDSAGDVLVVANFGIDSQNGSSLFVKYDAAGNELLRRTSVSTANTVFRANSMTVDANSNLAVSGIWSDLLVSRAQTIYYSAAGIEQWRAIADAATEPFLPSNPIGVAADGAGNVLVAVRTYRVSGSAVEKGVLIKYAPSGLEVWRASIEEPFAFALRALALDQSGNAFLAGVSFVNGVGPVALVLRVNADGTVAWRSVASAGDGNEFMVTNLTTDAFGNVYLAGAARGCCGQVDTDFVVVKYNAAGREVWRTAAAGSAALNDQALQVLAGPQGELLVSGHMVDRDRPAAMTVAKFIQDAATPPSAPAITAAIPGDGQATLVFQPPASEGGAAISSYTVTCNPGNIVSAGAASPIVVTALANDVQHACVVMAVNAVGSSLASAAAMVTPSAAAGISLVGVESRKQHGAAGNFPLPILANPALTIEPRMAGGGHTIAFVFDRPVAAFGVQTAMDQTGQIVPLQLATGASNEIVLVLSSVSDQSRVSLTVAGVNGALDVSAVLGFLLGDVSDSRRVTAGDISAVKARRGQPTDAVNFRSDVNVSGSIDGADLSAVRVRSGRILP